ncbi:MAG: CDP-alcohol phosphatidyltransferase family protein [Phycisphaerae bacterium]|jgi:CDP-diacylglycerol--glycerol-3-phosphate 3-phosphatidyltransferase
MANGFTTLRLGLLFVLVVLASAGPPALQLAGAPLLAVLFILDGVDGYVARRRNEATEFGALYDIAADRLVEYVLWIVACDLGFVAVWVPILFCTRGVLVDLIRTHFARHGQTPFGMMHTRLGRWLVAGRFMRIGYAAVKMLAFGWIFLLLPIPELYPSAWRQWASPALAVLNALVGLAAVLCVARGVPVIVDAVLALRASRGSGAPSEVRPASEAHRRGARPAGAPPIVRHGAARPDGVTAGE